MTRTWSTAVAVAGAATAGALATKRRELALPQSLSLALCAAVPAGVATALPRGRLRAAATWAAQMWAYKTAFEVPYDRPERLRARLHVNGPIAADRALGLGIPPGERLQRRLRRPPALTNLDRALTAVYLAWELEPHAALAWILLRHPDRFPLAALRLGATFDATLLGYFGLPSAPPWWASEREGRMNRVVRRVTAEVVKELRGRPRPGVDHAMDANPWAAMPSDHFASALATAFALADVHRGVAAVAVAYALALGCALVYTGEHYVVDLLAGAALATAVNRMAPRALGPAARLSGALAR